jgi:hypothetical protein
MQAFWVVRPGASSAIRDIFHRIGLDIKINTQIASWCANVLGPIAANWAAPGALIGAWLVFPGKYLVRIPPLCTNTSSAFLLQL